MSDAAILVDRSGGVGRLVLNRPECGNAIDMALADVLHAEAASLAADDRVRCIVLTGSGRLFCAGGDVAAFAAAGEQTSAFLRALADKVHQTVLLLTTMAKPLVVAVNGPAAGAGPSLALLGDVVLAARTAHFTTAYGSIGLTTDGGMTWLLPRLIGLRRAQEMLLANRRIDADVAEQWGLVTRVTAPGTLDAETRALANRLVDAPVAALGGARRLLHDGVTRTLAAHLDAEAARIAEAGGHDEATEGIAAFRERRTPVFRHD
ncbi:enoyl-CoA hydratase-related protein [uncultured Sphingomonas sp.]|uniref:enoyl-CoA hydratase/isomerase family protein n=1 Tax=uncultured Sphingomonas sp. TaxID=158754 RepID=UPI00260017E1|nr:enoyl-CoA hydratase-related protein [uncultured Sphingomonas sp.]